MNRMLIRNGDPGRIWKAAVWLGLWAAVLPMNLLAFNLTVVDGNNTPIANYRWLLEEDNTTWTEPGQPTNGSISMVIHHSHAPVVATGSATSATVSIPVPNPTKRYVVSAMADGYSVGGQLVGPEKHPDGSVVVVINANPIPTTQISILVFHDNHSINNAPDATEEGLPGFRVILADAGGGPVWQDAFGNPLGTTYKQDAQGNFLTDPNTGYQIDVEGDGLIYTDANGKALIKYLAPGKYGVQVIPPTGTKWTAGHGAAFGGKWNQTATIEGTLTVDAWVKANEPAVFLEGFGPGFYHVFFGFVDPDQLPWRLSPPLPASGVTVRGTNIFNHFGRPPNNQLFADGPPVNSAWIGLNELGALGVPGRGLYAAPANADGSFEIPNVPPGTYQLVTWDTPLDALFGFNTITVPENPPGGVYDLGNVLSYRWFGTLEGSVFYDTDRDGFRDPEEEGIDSMAVNLRFRNGAMYMATTTDATGDYEMAEVFPFFKWLVVEVDFTRFKATGLTTVVDEGGIIPKHNGWIMPSDNVRNPQPQAEVNVNTGNNLSRTDTNSVLSQATHLFLNQNNRIDWGKVYYGPNENGGISGIVGYGITRAEDDPRYAVIEPWEPGIPRVQVVLYRDQNSDTWIDDVDGDGTVTMSDVDNHPLGWAEGGLKGTEDIDRNADGDFDTGDAIQVTWTDSWDDNMPTGAIQPNPPIINGKPIIGSDNYGTWNQVRPGVFDGGYAFEDYHPEGKVKTPEAVAPLPPGNYIVQAIPPFGYKIQSEASKNVDFGESFVPSQLLLPPKCIGDTNPVPTYLELFPEQQIKAPFAGQMRAAADRKWVQVSNGKNAACDFHMYTLVPKASRLVGFVLNDLTAEFNAFSPIFGEKGSPGWLPISIRDWAGNEVARCYSDEFGSYNVMVPSTYTVNVPSPSGVSPNMLTIILNDPTMPDPAKPGQRIADPHHNPNFSVTPWTFQHYPGGITYVDTPIVPIASYVGYPNKQLDVEPPSGTPVINSVTVTYGPAGAPRGPVVTNILTDFIGIAAKGLTAVPNPDLLFGLNATIQRDYGFGDKGANSKVTINGIPLTIAIWKTNFIIARLPANTPLGDYQLMVTRDNGAQPPTTSPIGVTLTYANPAVTPIRYVPLPGVPSASDPYPTPIQDVIDAAHPGDLIVINPGFYNENPILHKPVSLRGSGPATVINANPVPTERVTFWHQKVASLLGGDPFVANENPGILVLGNDDFKTRTTRIDGFKIFGSIAGGGIALFHNAHNVVISNNRISQNQGTFGGGISVGMQSQLGTLYDNKNLLIEWNEIFKNGGVDGPGGIALYHGAEGYTIRNNFIQGNFSRLNGGGIGQVGVCRGGLIAHNIIRNNEVFFGLAVGGDGGGIAIRGEVVAGGVGTGSGSVTIINNLIQGNLSGSGRGGGIFAAGINGADLSGTPQPPAANWYALDIINNIIVNNAAGYSGGGIALQDAAKARIIHNTIAHNDSVATARNTFVAGAENSTPQGAGVVSLMNSPLFAALSGSPYSDPVIENNILWRNQSYYFDSHEQEVIPGTPFYRDLAVEGIDPALTPLHPVNCLISELLAGNISGDPRFLNGYTNELYVAIAVDEGGNNINIRFEPTGPRGNYHLDPASPAINQLAGAPVVAYDYDRQVRPEGLGDIGADESSLSLPGNVTWPVVAQVGPAAGGTAPGIGLPLGAGTPPGPMVRPPDLNGPPVDPEPLIDSDGDGDPANDVIYMRLGAGDGWAKMGDTNELYGFGFVDLTSIPDHKFMEQGKLKAEFSAPTIVLKEGQHFYLDLANVGMAMRPDLFDPHTVHFHGFPQAASIFDGEPMASVSINIGGIFRYYYQIVEPGTFLYHCHEEATEHMEMGMLGNLYVMPKQNNLPNGTDLNGFTHATGNKYAYNDGDGSTFYHVEALLQLGAFDRNFHELHIAVQDLPFADLDESYPMINGRGYPDTINTAPLINETTGNASQKIHAKIEARRGQKILLRISNVSISDFHTLTVLGIPMKVIGKDARLLRGPTGKNLYYDTTSITLGGGETADAILDTTGLAPGTYFIYDARLNHLCNDQEDFGGMMTEITIK